LSRKLGFDNGFDEFIAPTGISPKDGWSESSTTGSVVLLSKASLAKEQADIAIRWMADQREHRFFLWVHFIDTHPPYNHHAGVVEFGLDQDSAADHELRFTDSQIGRILAWLKESGIGERTAVFVTSDHGTYHGRHQLPPQGRYLYSDYTRIPLIVHIPGVHAGRVSDPVSHVDLLPTIAQIAGIPIGIPLPGTSLLPIIADEPRSHSPRPIFQVVSLGDQERRAVVEGCSLMIHNILPELTFERYDTCNPGTELLQDQYDPVRDANLRNLLLRLEDANQVPLPAWTP
jgi:arylsulfatase A-like enzyme